MAHDFHEGVPAESRGGDEILLCTRYGIGDLVMELPALSALRNARPRSRITALAAPPAHQVLDGDPRVDEVVRTSRWGLRHRWDEGDAPTRAALESWLRERRFDLVLDAGHAVVAVKRAVAKLGLPTTNSAERAETGALAGGSGAQEAIRQSVGDGWGIPVPDHLDPDLRLTSAERRAAQRVLTEFALDGTRPFAISPVASSPLKRWPLERFSRVADHVIRKGAGPVVIFEGPDARAGERVARGRRTSGRIIRIGALHLRTTAAILERCRALVCHDTGLMHLAAAVGTPVVGVFGPTRPEVFLPATPTARSAAPRGVTCGWRDTGTLFPPDCVTVGRCLIGRDGCIGETPTDEVLAAVDEVLRFDSSTAPPAGPARECSLQPGGHARSPFDAGSMAPNRLLDLDELDRPEVRRLLAELDGLVASDPVSYLHPGKRWEYPWAIERAELAPGARVLDVGAGDSILPVYLAKRGHRVTAVDVAFDGSLGERHGVDIDYVRADLTDMPLPSESFDAVFCISVIEHLPEHRVDAALGELRRVLRPGAPLLLTTDYYDDADAEIWHRSDDDVFQVDWTVFDEGRLRRHVLAAPGWRVEGEVDLEADWDEVKPAMRAFHGYPYTSVGVKLVRA